MFHGAASKAREKFDDIHSDMECQWALEDSTEKVGSCIYSIIPIYGISNSPVCIGVNEIIEEMKWLALNVHGI